MAGNLVQQNTASLETCTDVPRQIPLNVLTCLQVLEIDEHKFYLSINEGRDVGEESAFFNWSLNPDYEHSLAASFRQRAELHYDEILGLCRQHCGGFENCRGVGNCSVTKRELHEALRDFI